MAITLGTPTTAAPSSTATYTCDKPAGVANGDVLVAFLHTAFRTVSTPPSGWTLVDSWTAAADPKTYVYTKAITDAGSEPASYSWTLSGSDDGLIAIVAVSGAIDHATNAFESADAREFSVTSFTSPAVTPSDADSLVLRLANSQSEGALTPPGDETELLNIVNDSTEGMSVTYFTHGTTSTGSNTFTIGVADEIAGITFAIAPAAEEGGVEAAVSQTLPALTQSATATAKHQAATAQTLPALTQSAAATTKHQAAIAQTLPALTQSATAGNGAISAAVAQTLPALTQSATATTKHHAVVAQSLPALTQAATATPGDEAEGVTAVVAQSLPALTQAVAATTRHQAAIAQTLPALTQAALVGELVLGDVPILSIRRPFTVHTAERPITVLSVPLE